MRNCFAALSVSYPDRFSFRGFSTTALSDKRINFRNRSGARVDLRHVGALFCFAAIERIDEIRRYAAASLLVMCSLIVHSSLIFLQNLSQQSPNRFRQCNAGRRDSASSIQFVENQRRNSDIGFTAEEIKTGVTASLNSGSESGRKCLCSPLNRRLARIKGVPPLFRSPPFWLKTPCSVCSPFAPIVIYIHVFVYIPGLFRLLRISSFLKKGGTRGKPYFSGFQY